MCHHQQFVFVGRLLLSTRWHTASLPSVVKNFNYHNLKPQMHIIHFAGGWERCKRHSIQPDQLIEYL
jgi:hypothetical protein